MARPSKNLTKRLIDAAAVGPGCDEVFHWDLGVKGFGLRVKPSRIVDGVKVPGGKSFVLKYRMGGKVRRWTISKVGSPYTVEEAREVAKTALENIRKGIDPMIAKVEEREASTVAELADLYLAEGPALKPNKKASSWKTDLSIINRHIKPLLGRKLAKSLTTLDVARFQANVAAGKTAADIKTRKQGRAIVKGGKGIAARSLAVLAAMLSYAKKQELLPANPAVGVEAIQGEKKERFLSLDEVTAMADALLEMESEGLNKNAPPAIRLLLLTGCRRGEILSLRWEYVDFVHKCLRLPDSKTGWKIVILPDEAIDLLLKLHRNRKNPWVLPGSPLRSNSSPNEYGDYGPYTGLQKVWKEMRERATVILIYTQQDLPEGQLVARLKKGDALPSYAECVAAAADEGWIFPVGLTDVRLRDLRHSFASFAIGEGESLFVVGKMLGHKQARTTAIYAHLADDLLRAAAARTAKRINGALKGTAAAVTSPAHGLPGKPHRPPPAGHF